MKRYINHLISIVVLAVFLAMAWACSFGDGRIYANDCEFSMPSSSRTQKINIVVVDKLTNLPLSGVAVKIYYNKYDKTQISTIPGTKCELIPEERVTQLGSTDNSGMFSLSATNTYYSSEDYIFGTIVINLDGYYRDDYIGYFKLGPNKISETLYFSLLKINDSP